MIPYTVGHVVTVIAVPLTPGTTAVNSYSLFPLPSSTLLQGWVQAVCRLGGMDGGKPFLLVIGRMIHCFFRSGDVKAHLSYEVRGRWKAYSLFLEIRNCQV